MPHAGQQFQTELLLLQETSAQGERMRNHREALKARLAASPAGAQGGLSTSAIPAARYQSLAIYAIFATRLWRCPRTRRSAAPPSVPGPSRSRLAAMAAMSRSTSPSRVKPAGESVLPRVVSINNTSDRVPAKSARGERVWS